MLTADTISIHRLHLRGDKRGCRHLLQEIHGGWTASLPAHLQNSWILIKALNVSSRTRDWRQHASSRLQSVLQQAVPASAGNLAHVNAIRFESLPEMIAFLLSDLAMGRTSAWYWQQWQHLLKYPRDEALARLLLQEPESIPAIVGKLIERKTLPAVWSQLSSGSAITVAREMARYYQLTLPPVVSDPQPVSNSGHAASTVMNRIIRSTASAWRTALTGMPQQDGRVVLASIVHGLICTPITLRREAETWFSAFAVATLVKTVTSTESPLNPAGVNTRKSTETDPASLNRADSFRVDSDHRDEPLRIFPASNATKNKQNESPLLNNSERSIGSRKKQNAQTKSGHYDNKAKTLEPTAADDVAAKANVDAGKSGATEMLGLYGESAFKTESGGLFYLLNPLNRLLNSAATTEQEIESGWHLLWDIYRAIVKRYSAAVSIDAAMQAFLMAQMFPFASRTEQATLFQQHNSMPVSAVTEAIFQKLDEQMMSMPFWQALHESASFLATPAHIVSSPSHLDVYFPLNAARIDLRSNAWDVNPGWLPWLGRVVTFHYVTDESGGR